MERAPISSTKAIYYPLERVPGPAGSKPARWLLCRTVLGVTWPRAEPGDPPQSIPTRSAGKTPVPNALLRSERLQSSGWTLLPDAPGQEKGAGEPAKRLLGPWKGQGTLCRRTGRARPSSSSPR